MPGERQSFSAPRGTADLLPPESLRWQENVRLALDIFERAGYSPIETPIFEATEVFERGVGETSEVVGKQMYTFLDRGGRSLTLRPEGTAPVIRAVLEHNLAKAALPLKLCYAGPMFRQERPQKGRMRQFFQLGIEAIGSAGPLVDAEVIEIGERFVAALGVEATLHLNSIGHPDPACRGAYQEALRTFLRDRSESLAEADRERVDTNPMRTFDSKEQETIAVMKEAPLITEFLCDECRDHFEGARGYLDDLEVGYVIDAKLVRGLDYYTRTAFEFKASDLGSQDTVLAGGRYDGLSESLGGPPLPGIGFASGLERLMLSGSKGDETKTFIDAYVVAVGDGVTTEAMKLATRLRRKGFGVDIDLLGRSMKGQMKDAARSGARWALVLGEDEVKAGEVALRDMTTATQERIPIGDVERRLSR